MFWSPILFVADTFCPPVRFVRRYVLSAGRLVTDTFSRRYVLWLVRFVADSAKAEKFCPDTFCRRIFKVYYFSFYQNFMFKFLL